MKFLIDGNIREPHVSDNFAVVIRGNTQEGDMAWDDDLKRFEELLEFDEEGKNWGIPVSEFFIIKRCIDL